MLQASDRLAAGAVHAADQAAHTPSGTETTMDHAEVSTAQLADHAPSVVASTEVRGGGCVWGQGGRGWEAGVVGWGPCLRISVSLC